MITSILRTSSVVLLLTLASKAFATPLLITDASSSLFNGATNLTFDGETTGSFGQRDFNGGDLTFTALSGGQLAIENSFSSSTFNFNLEDEYLLSPNSTTGFKIDFNVDVDTFGFTWAARDKDWTIDLFGEGGLSLGSVTTSQRRGVYTDFFGLSENTGFIRSAVFTSSAADYTMLDNFKYTTNFSSTVAEPASLLLFAIGLIGLGVFRKLSKQDS